MGLLGPVCIFFTSIFVITAQIAPCERTSLLPLDLSIEEAAAEDLLSNPNHYEADIDIHGILNSSDSAVGITLVLKANKNTPSQIAINRLFVLESRPINHSKNGLSEKIVIRLNEPLDRDGATYSPLDDLNVIDFTIECTRVGSRSTISHVAGVNIIDVNDNSPEILGNPQPITVTETASVGGTVGELIKLLSVVDKDEGRNRQVIYNVVSQTGGANKFRIVNEYRGTIILASPLDFEQITNYKINVSVTDQPIDISQRLTTYATINLTVTDADDLGPVFDYPDCLKVENVCFNPTYTTKLTHFQVGGALILQTVHNSVRIVKMYAMDQDTLNAPIEFTIPETIPSGYQNRFVITTTKVIRRGYEGSISQISPIEREDIRTLRLIVKATEMTVNRRFYRAFIDASLGPLNNSCIVQDSEPSGNNTPLVGGVLGTILALVVVVLVIVLIKQRTKTTTKGTTERELPVYQNEVVDEIRTERRHSSKKYEDIGMRSPDNLYDELQQAQYVEPQ